jgi:hypothetical protein
LTGGFGKEHMLKDLGHNDDIETALERHLAYVANNIGLAIWRNIQARLLEILSRADLFNKTSNFSTGSDI